MTNPPAPPTPATSPRAPRRPVRRIVAGTILVAAAVGAAIVIRRSQSRHAEAWQVRDAAADAIRRGDVDFGAATLEAHVAQHPDDALAWALLAHARLGRGDTAAAQDAGTRALQLAPESAEARIAVAACRVSARDPGAALAALGDATGGAAAMVRWQANAALGRVEAAVDAIGAAEESDEIDPQILLDAAAAAAALSEREFVGAKRVRGIARKLADRVVAATLDARDPEASAFARALADLLHDRPGADESIDAARRDERTSVRARSLWIRRLVRSGRTNEAAAAAAATSGPDGLALAAELGAAGRPDAEIDVLRSRRRSSPHDDAARAALLRALVRTGRLRDAVAESRDVAADGSTSVDLLVASATVAAATGDPARCEDLLRGAERLRPADPSVAALRRANLLASAESAIAAGRALTTEQADAEAALRASVAADPRDPVASGWAARLALARGHAAEALGHARRNVAAAPASREARARLHVLLCRSSDPTELDAYVRELLSSGAAPAVDCAELATFALAAGRVDAALRLTTSALESRPDDAAITKIHVRALVAAGSAESASRRLDERFGPSCDDPEVVELRAWTDALTGRRREIPDAVAPESEAAATARVRALLASGRFDAAETAARDALRAHPASPRVGVALAEVLVARDRFAEAADLVEPLVGDDAADLVAARVLADALLRAGDGVPRRAERIARLRDVLASHPSGATELLRIDARLALAAGRHAEAAGMFTRYLAAVPSDADAWFDAATAREGAGETDAARDLLSHALRLAPGHPRARAARLRLDFEAAARALGAGDSARARAAILDLVEREPGWIPGRIAASVVLLDEGLPALSAEQCRKILEADPRELVARLVLAYARFGAGDRDGALADVDGLVAERPELAVLRVKRGLLRLMAGRTADAEQDFRAAAGAGAKGGGLETGLAMCALAAGRRDESVRLARDAVALEPRSAPAHRVLATVLAATGDGEGAVAAWLATVALAPDDVRPLVLAAEELVRRGRWSDVLDAADRLGPPEGALLLAKARAEWSLGRRSEARRHAEAAAARQPSAWTAAAAMADEDGDPVNAARLYDAAIRAGAADDTIRARLATLRLDAGRPAEAVALLEPLVAAHPDVPGLLNNLATALAAEVPEPEGVPSADDAAARARRLERPLRIAARAAELAPGVAAVAGTLGRIRFLAGDFDGAEDSLRRARGDTTRAAEWFRRAADESPQASWAARARKYADGR